jgi:hypothetical protein
MRRLLGLVVIGVLLLSACDRDKAKEEARARNSCGPAPAAMPGSPQLPPGFQAPDKVAYTSSAEAGPSTIVTGFFTGDLNDVYDAYRSGFGTAGYEVTKSENDGPDAEVDWSGGSTTGEVRLAAACTGRTDVTLTIRPA